MYKLLITRPIPQKVIKRAQKFFDVHVRQSVIPSSKFELINALQNYDAIIAAIGDKFSKEIFESSKSPRTKIISNFGVGYDHLDLNSARQKNIQITNTPDVVTNATADIAMTLMFWYASIPWIEIKILRTRPAYKDYQKRVHILFPEITILKRLIGK